MGKVRCWYGTGCYYNDIRSKRYYVNGTEEFNATLDSVFSGVWSGDQTMQEAIEENLDELNEIFEENNA